MPDARYPDRFSDRIRALTIVCALALASAIVVVSNIAPTRVSAGELLGAVRAPGEIAFVAGHRGDSTVAPENTLPAVRAAIAAGYDYVEVDVALTADGVPVLMHDATVDRTTDGRGPLAELTLDQVRRLDAGSWFAPAHTGTPVPTFSEFAVVLAASDRRALVELKGEWDAGSVNALVAQIHASGLERRLALLSFDADTLGYVESASEVISRLAILRAVPDDVVGAVRALGAYGAVVNGKAVLAEPEIVDELHAAGLRIAVYTFNQDRQWRAALDLGVDGIVTDTPAELVRWLAAEAETCETACR